MCGGGKSKAPAPAAPTYQYYPEASRTPNQQAAAVEASQQPTGGFGSELTTGAAPSTAAKTSGAM